jgi:hypothetical protein
VPLRKSSLRRSMRLGHLECPTAPGMRAQAAKRPPDMVSPESSRPPDAAVVEPKRPPDIDLRGRLQHVAPGAFDPEADLQPIVFLINQGCDLEMICSVAPALLSASTMVRKSLGARHLRFPALPQGRLGEPVYSGNAL